MMSLSDGILPVGERKNTIVKADNQEDWKS